jgi:hypothetical protein
VTPTWLIINRASSPTTVTRPSCRQCDSPPWSHTAFLSRFHARCRSPLWLHKRQIRLLGRSRVESLQSHMILTMSHWSSGLICLLPATRVTGSNPLGGLMWIRDSPVSAVSLQAQQRKFKTVRGSYTGLDLSIHAKKGPKKSRDTLPLKTSSLWPVFWIRNYLQARIRIRVCNYIWLRFGFKSSSVSS